jgi:hypothetical protein
VTVLSVRTAILVATAAVVLAAGCEPIGPAAPRARAPKGTRVELAGTFTFTPEGALVLTLAEPCTKTQSGVYSQQVLTPDAECDRSTLAKVALTAMTPWGGSVNGVWLDARRVEFRPAWGQTGIDPLADSTPYLITGAWTIGPLRWMPSLGDAQRMLGLIGDATDTQPELVRGGAPPSLEVSAIDVGGGALEAGGQRTVTVKVSNRGEGAAYRVVVTTRSSVAALHDQRLSYGRIAPGASKSRQLVVRLPMTESASDAMLVLVVGEGNGFAPHNVSRRVPIHVASAPVLTVRCAVVDRDPARPQLDAGETVDLRCTVSNTGSVAGQVRVQLTVAGAAQAGSNAKDLAGGASTVFDLPITIPRDLPLDAPVEIAVTAIEARYQRNAATTLTGVIHMPKLCTAGQLTRAQYDARIRELRAAVAAGDLTQAELDRYEAELVGCLQ